MPYKDIQIGKKKHREYYLKNRDVIIKRAALNYKENREDRIKKQREYYLRTRKPTGEGKGHGKGKKFVKGQTAWNKGLLNQLWWAEKNPRWNGGITYRRSGGNYIGERLVKCPKEYVSMARKDGYVPEHRLIMAMSLKRFLLKDEVVHHLDHNPRNNDINNLALFPNRRFHKRFELCENLSVIFTAEDLMFNPSNDFIVHT